MKVDLMKGAQRLDSVKNKNGWHLGRFYMNKAVIVTIMICLFLVLVGMAVMIGHRKIIMVNDKDNEPEGTLLGASEIYPSVMVEGHAYEWRRGRAIVGFPKDCVYYGEINHISGKKPNENCEFVSVFSVSGQIYTIPENADCVYLRLTTEWMEDRTVVFDLVE
ncbi:MAG: hypothetical protein K6E47_16255 [Lachnospiraceae bacterium]|nr:hypothetical protein [Lachnospiraceae bacterium]